jgi:hypothetical protein
VKPKGLLAWSSGKDSAWSLHVLRQRREVEVVGLLTTFNAAAYRVAMHAVRRELVESQARLAPAHRGLRSRLVVAILCYAQPLVRSWARYRTRLFHSPAPAEELAPEGSPARRFPLPGRLTVADQATDRPGPRRPTRARRARSNLGNKTASKRS